jgi:hypothetical protein
MITGDLRRDHLAPFRSSVHCARPIEGACSGPVRPGADDSTSETASGRQRKATLMWCSPRYPVPETRSMRALPESPAERRIAHRRSAI